MVRFNYKGTDGRMVKNVIANFMRVEAGVAHFGIVRNNKSTAHPGYRPINVSNLSNVRIAKRSPKT